MIRLFRSFVLLLFAALAAGLPVHTAVAGEPVYQSHFEDEVQQLFDWNVALPDDGGQVEVRRLAPSDRSEGFPPQEAALTIQCGASHSPLRIAQVKELLKLDPERAYEMQITLRAPAITPGKGGRARFMVTNARWTWSSPSITLDRPQEEWQTLSIPFTVPQADVYRIRFEALNVDLKLEVAEIAVVATQP